MKYDFTTIMNRNGKDAIAVEAPLSKEASTDSFVQATIRDDFDVIPMWVADMNFPTLPAISKAIIARAEHPSYGYYSATQAYYDAIIHWHESRNGATNLTKECIGYENGVLGGVVSALRVLCSTGDKVLLQSPTYIGFTHCIEDNGWGIVLNPLVQDEKGVWRMDYADIEDKIVKNEIHTAVFCSPHNPTGRVWERWEIEKAMEIYKKYNVYVVSDEIWSDLILPGYHHIPTQSISDDARNRTIAMYAPSKTFNLAGLIGSYHIIYNEYLRARVRQESQSTHYNSLNVLSMHALIAAYSAEGAIWTDELCTVLDGNLTYAVDFIHSKFHGVKVTKPEGTYMLFLDCTDWCAAHGKTIEEMQKSGIEVGVIWQDGRLFHGACHVRLNLALPRTRVEEAFARLETFVFAD
ncbi:MAG: aminotransferase class I/II-fold pyridoxal phosphate-dependent enzyme [Ruthenibacterium sp.]